MATANDSSIQTNDGITECAICLDTFKQPTLLPCMHTFCRECLQKYYTNEEQTNDEVVCPLCRHSFVLPPEGCEMLPENSFMSKLVDIEQFFRAHAAVDDVSEKKLVPNCDLANCDLAKCSLAAEYDQIRNNQLQKKASFLCEMHPDEDVNCYCVKCSLAVCSLCYIDGHDGHGRCDVIKVAEKVSQQLDEDYDAVQKCVVNSQDELERLHTEEQRIASNISDTNKSMSSKCQSLVNSIIDQRNKISRSLAALKDRKLNEIKERREVVRRRLMIGKSFVDNCEELRGNRALYVASNCGESLHALAQGIITKQLITNNQPVARIDVSFQPETAAKNLIGEILMKETNAEAYSKCSVIQNILPRHGRVYAVTVLGAEIFLVREKTSQVEGHFVTSFAPSRRFNIPQLYVPWDIVSSQQFNCLYISDHIHRAVFKVLVQDGSVTKWSISSRCNGLSVTPNHNVLVCLFEVNKINEYLPTGKLVREITLQDNVTNLRHCVQLSADHFIVSHCSFTQHRVCIVNSNGRLLRSFGDRCGGREGQLNTPSYVAVDDRGYVLVTDVFNNRVVVLTPNLQRVGNVALPAGVQLQQPINIYLDQGADRLYVSEMSGGRVLALGTQGTPLRCS